MQPTNEKWLPVPGYEGIYEVSDQGRVRSLARTKKAPYGRTIQVPEKVLTPSVGRRGHLSVTLCKNGTRKPVGVHRLVVEAFIEPIPEGGWVLHWNDDPADNRPDNLRIGTPSDNMRDQVRNGRHHNRNKTHCPQGHPYEGDNLYIHLGAKNFGHRSCVACMDARYI